MSRTEHRVVDGWSFDTALGTMPQVGPSMWRVPLNGGICVGLNQGSSTCYEVTTTASRPLTLVVTLFTDIATTQRQASTSTRFFYAPVLPCVCMLLWSLGLKGSIRKIYGRRWGVNRAKMKKCMRRIWPKCVSGTHSSL